MSTNLSSFQVHVSMEYSRKVSPADGTVPAASGADRVMDFGSVFVVSKDGDNASVAPSAASNQQNGLNVAELLVARGLATVIRHRDFEERSNCYDSLLSAESRAIAGKKGMHSPKDSPAVHVTDLTTVSALLLKSWSYFSFDGVK